MKTFSALLLCSVSWFIVLPAAQLVGSPLLSRCRMDLGSRIIQQVTAVDLQVEERLPPNLVVSVVAEVPSGGYSQVQLVRAVYATPPADGIQDYFLLGVPPAGAATQAVTEIRASDHWVDYERTAPWLLGVRVHGAGKSVIVRMLTESRCIPSQV